MNTSISSQFKLGIKVGGKELAFSGFVHLDSPEVAIEINDVIYEFRFTSNGGASSYSSRVEGEKKLIIELFNHSNVLGEGEYVPLEIGKMAGRKHYLTYVAYTTDVEKNLRRLEFAFYLGDAV